MNVIDEIIEVEKKAEDIIKAAQEKAQDIIALAQSESSKIVKEAIEQEKLNCLEIIQDAEALSSKRVQEFSQNQDNEENIIDNESVLSAAKKIVALVLNED